MKPSDNVNKYRRFYHKLGRVVGFEPTLRESQSRVLSTDTIHAIWSEWRDSNPRFPRSEQGGMPLPYTQICRLFSALISALGQAEGYVSDGTQTGRDGAIRTHDYEFPKLGG
jgi:hypothetical protein